MEKAKKNIVTFVALLLAVASFALVLSACSSNESRSMTDDEIRELVSSGDEETLETVRQEIPNAIDEALSGFELPSDQQASIKNAIISSVDERIDRANSSENKSKEEQKPSNDHPRIKDGTLVPTFLSIESRFVRSVDSEHEFEYTITGYSAKAYNFSQDTPYAGGGYAYNIFITMNVSQEYVHKHEPTQVAPDVITNDEGIAIAPSLYCTLGTVFSPYGQKNQTTSSLGGISREENSDNMTVTFSIPTNLVPNKITITSFDVE